MLSFLDDFAIVEIFVDHALRRSIEGVAQQPRRVLRQGTDAQFDRAQRFEALRQMGAEIVSACFIIDLKDLPGRKKLEAMDVEVRSLVEYEGH